MGQIGSLQRPHSATESLHALLFKQIVSLELRPGQKISEIEIASKYDVSRQPVRDAFYRLSQQGLIQIRPQRSTVITFISTAHLYRARFIRVALEKEIALEAAKEFKLGNATALNELIRLQQDALDLGSPEEFYALDERFHQILCDIAGQPDVWTLICGTKASADRVRFLSLAFDGQAALQDHKNLVAALQQRNGQAAAEIIDIHLSRALVALPRIQSNHPDCFKEPL